MGQPGAMGKCQLCDSHINGRLRDREEGSITAIIGHIARCSARRFSGLRRLSLAAVLDSGLQR